MPTMLPYHCGHLALTMHFATKGYGLARGFTMSNSKKVNGTNNTSKGTSKGTRKPRKGAPAEPQAPVTVVGATGKPIAVETVEQRRAKTLAKAGMSPNELAVLRLLAQYGNIGKGKGKAKVATGWVGHKVLRGIAPTAKTLGAVTSRVTNTNGDLTLGVQGGGLQARGLVESLPVEAIGASGSVHGGGRLAARLTPAGIAYVESLPASDA